MSNRKQEYIARIKYSNTLPPPTVPPKLLKYPINKDEEVDSPQLITSLYTKTNVTPLINIDRDLAMPMDLMQLPGLLNKNDTTYLYGLENIKLNSKDRVLLRDPRVDKNVKTDTQKVSFLRRTEYLSSTITSGNSSSSLNALNNKKRLRSDEDDDYERMLNAPEIVTKVESTFDTMSHDLDSFKHPIKRNLKAVKTWDLLPDTASMDQNYFTLRLVGSAALDARERGKLGLNTAIFRPVELEEDEWISMYTTDKNDSKILEKNIEKVIDEDVKNIEDDDKSFKFKRLRDFDMKHVTNMPVTTNTANPFGEVAIVFNDDKKIAYYKPLRSRIELRRRRVNDVFRTLVKEHNIDQLNIKLRNPTTKEANVRDRLRMKFDPINFVPVDEDEEDGDEEDSKTKSTQEMEEDTKEETQESQAIESKETSTSI
ncbi:RNA polymerase II-associated protein 1 [Monosporozyma servazzii]